MAPKGCCTLTLRQGVKIIAVIEIIGCAILITLLTLLMANITIEGRFALYLEVFFGLQREIQFLLGYGCWTFVLIDLILDISLYKGAHNNSHEACQIWLKVSGGSLIMAYIWCLMSINLFWDFRKCITTLSVGALIGVYKGIQMFIVYKFIKQVKKSRVQLNPVSVTTSITDLHPDLEDQQDHDFQNCIEGPSAPALEFDNRYIHSSPSFANSRNDRPAATIHYPSLRNEFF